ncbi:peptidoglycan DD-metalloendopeptidase family protein [Flavobacteriaceae bacterium]|uniref:murein hydrolase activator EnvC family protein n=1 Tax=Candidatus Arcticimaribacter forsetii TaxID=2820661 RepID=UPI0020774040|nr:peptidoglycan DD-metalloendopeptidase family protein [Candidatus Arcticimaribacter forsetii]MDA8698659.1 peptidoglycan DD-metalloendopeptidase family protein [Flavobacteriaceae bacterium]MDB2329591.1 peptidoglycan DD-metalloendopeptidase family protein [Flavobacteriaceae bacterium]MDB4673958.1 peptidoglycan DD-metalloendopeptidase family protein [Flavobacteriaceae bacterium]MDB4716605.1 peptidoglycan DD-metalloendopeptidase family protein [Flavobacteriaceae bacterium]
MKKVLPFSTKVIIALLSLMTFINSANGQDKRQKNLENQRKQLQEEIKQINKLLFSNKKQKKTVLTEVEDLTLKIDVRVRLIRVTNEQANRLTQQINVNQRSIDRQRKELKTLKEDYSQMILKSYQSNSGQSRMMFLFSSESFLQAYKRTQYLNQYISFRKKQGELIAEKTITLQQLNLDLLDQKLKKENLVKENKTAQQQYQKEQSNQQKLIKQLKKKERSFVSQIKKKQKKAEAINKEIQRLIREAIAASNRAAGKKTNAKAFTLTPEDQLISDNIIANKGKLPWPVEQGVVIQKYGKQPHPVVKTTMIQSNGVTIATPPSSEARAVFEGKVMSIIGFKGSNPTVLIQHGNYITTYSNLGEVYVVKGQKVKAKEKIGKVFTNPETGKTELKFSVFKNSSPTNPKGWLFRM